MTNKEKIQQEIERTLLSLDNVSRAEANPYLFTRIKARMQRPSNGWEKVSSFISRPVIAFAVLALVVALNGLVLFNSNNTKTSEADNVSISSIADEYNMTFTTISDYENGAQNELYKK